MRKVLLIASLLMLAAFMARAQETDTCELFINTDPIGAEVVVDDTTLGVTPLRVADFKRGTVKIQLVKKGYLPVSSEQTIGPERRKLFFFTLSPVNLRITLEEKGNEVFINRESVGETPLSIKNIPPGSYDIKKDGETISISNATYRSLMRMTVLETFFCAGLFGVSLAGNISYGNKGQESEANVLGVSTAIFGGLLTYNLMKYLKLRTDYRKAIKEMSVVEVEPFDRKGPLEYFSEGMEHLGREAWEEAFASFLYVINAYPDAQVVPFSIYEAGYCLYRMDNPAKAAEYLRRFVYSYPVYELFPYGLYYLLETELDAGDAAQALSDYTALAPVRLEDPSGTLYRDYYRVLERLHLDSGGASPKVLTGFLGEVDEFLGRYPDSKAAAEITLIKGKLLYLYIDKARGEAILNDLRVRYRSDSYINTEVNRTLNVR